MGLGTENQDLPGFITIKPSLGHGEQNNWISSFLPGEYQGTPIGNSGMNLEEIEKEPMPYLFPNGLTAENQRCELDTIQKPPRGAERSRSGGMAKSLPCFDFACSPQSPSLPGRMIVVTLATHGYSLDSGSRNL